MGKTLSINLRVRQEFTMSNENLNGQEQVRRAKFQIYLTKIKLDFQTHKDLVFFIDTIQEIKNDKIIFKVFKKIKKILDNLNQDRLKTRSN